MKDLIVLDVHCLSIGLRIAEDLFYGEEDVSRRLLTPHERSNHRVDIHALFFSMHLSWLSVYARIAIRQILILTNKIPYSKSIFLIQT